jgi:hypothetical protein
MNRAARRASSCLEEVGGSRNVKVISTKPGMRVKKMKPGRRASPWSIGRAAKPP